MNILLWVLQVLLALVFLAHGWLLLSPPASMVDQINASIPRWLQLFIGTAEVLAAVGLTLPGLTRIQPWLVWCAAGGIMIVMICATVFHVGRGEYSSAASTVVLLVVATFVASRTLARRANPAPARQLRSLERRGHRSFRPQRLDRVDTGGAAGGQVTGHRRGEDHERGRTTDGDGIGGVQTIEEARHQAAAGERDANAHGGADEDQGERFAHDQRGDGVALGAERDAQPDLARPARDHVRHQAAERTTGEEQRHAAEERGDGREQPLLHERLVDAVAEPSRSGSAPWRPGF